MYFYVTAEDLKSGKMRFFYIGPMDKIIHISIKDGKATVDKCPDGCVVLLKDYDTKSTDDTVHKVYRDEKGTYTLEVYDHINFQVKNDGKSS